MASLKSTGTSYVAREAAGSNPMSNLPSILVTGSPRSGTTWVGRTLATDTSIKYVHERETASRYLGLGKKRSHLLKYREFDVE
jgi:hypothetical protein